MDELPMAPETCTLDLTDLGKQLSRYRLVGLGAKVVRDGPQRLVIRVDDAVANDVIAEAIRVERSCCPFFRIEWVRETRQLAIGVSRKDEVPALDAIRQALRTPHKAG